MPRFWRLIVLGLPLVTLVACFDDGPATKAGKSIDNAAQSLEDAFNPPGPAQKIGRALDKAVE